MAYKYRAIGFLAGWMGDVVMCTAAARSFKAEHPDFELTFAVGKKWANILPLIEGLPYVDKVHAWDGDVNWPSASDIVYLNQQKYDLVFNPMARHTRQDWYNYFHYVEETCRMLGTPFDGNKQCELVRPQSATKYDSKFITCSLWASGTQEYKTPKREVLEEVGRWAFSEGYSLVQLGMNDREMSYFVKPTKPFEITEVASIISQSQCHIAVDCGCGWMASAYKTPTLGIIGREYPDMRIERIGAQNPFNPNAMYINKLSVRDVTAEEIIERLEIILSDY
jgi:ADP-heptose:LPS heptosyltransferase